MPAFCIPRPWMIEEEKKQRPKTHGHDGATCRKTTNQRVGRIMKLFQWDVEKMLIEAAEVVGRIGNPAYLQIPAAKEDSLEAERPAFAISGSMTLCQHVGHIPWLKWTSERAAT